ncbi:hypothetical protein K1T71_011035 [Dendrolimus kikuchii]|uniref:Uncharacterized protein n=1 Tax=Dendrolimus kikuchii TaxID=765133 RepID=A0ACC1CMQ2_9NEOP|nr:hypothetical protein K1T71_011035 [Dendrolimus kikuchii]
MNVLIILFLIFLIASANCGKHDFYKGYSVHNIQLDKAAHLQLLHQLEGELNLDIWQHGFVGEREATVMVAPENSRQFLQELDENGIVHYLYQADVASALETYDEEIAVWKRTRSSRMIFQGYPRYEEVDSYLETIAAQYPNLVQVVNAGYSFEGRDIKYLKISSTNFNDRSKPIYFMDAMIHAREWVTTPVTLYTIYRLVENLRNEDRDVLEDVDWIILPVVNPDGYEYTHTDMRLWRRTRSVNLTNSIDCVGVDGNRNFDIFFNEFGVSSNPCSDIYPGPEPFSESETRIVRDILHEHVDRIQLYLNIHSYGNYVLFGFDNETLTDNVHQMHHVAASMGAVMDAMKLPEAGYYIIGNSAWVMYAAAGTAQDYGQHVGVPFSYTLELPGYSYDFRVPPSYMDQINEETWRSVVESARLCKLYYRARYSGN